MTGILTGVYDAWDSGLGHKNVKLETAGEGNMELFCEYVQVTPDTGKAEKVLRTVKKRMGEEAYEMIAYAISYPHDQKADAVYRMIVLGLHLPDGKKITGMLTQPDVRLVFELKRKAWHIAHRYMGFVRFREVQGGTLMSCIDAEADILALIAPHFSDRLPLENWLIYDRRRRKAAVHLAKKGFLLLEEVEEDAVAGLETSEEEKRFDALWRCFHKAIGIESRANGQLQGSLLPRKFREFMNEFAESESCREHPVKSRIKK